MGLGHGLALASTVLAVLLPPPPAFALLREAETADQDLDLAVGVVGPTGGWQGRPLNGTRSRHPRILRDSSHARAYVGTLSKSGAIALIPEPLSLRLGTGQFLLEPEAQVAVLQTEKVSDQEVEALLETAQLCAEQLRMGTGYAVPLAIIDQSQQQRLPLGDIYVSISPSQYDREEYALLVKESRVQIVGGSAAGVFYAFQTLRQLLPVEVFADGSRTPWQGWTAPVVSIRDKPLLSWRGASLDVSRHFMPVETIYKYIDLLSMHKLNVFHWHLCDDQGWRLEIRAYPRLTSVGARRDWSPPGTGYYDQEQVRSVVAFAKKRHVTVIPEIEMPGHSSAAIAAYPELGGKQRLRVMAEWGASSQVYNTKPETLQFLKNVLDEVMDLFPSPYIHIGGDEVSGSQWEQDDWERSHMVSLGLEDQDWVGLQTWLAAQVAGHLAARGRRAVGWAELAKGNLPKNVTLMSWTSHEPGIEVAARGYNVIMSPMEYTYLDSGHGDGDGDEFDTRFCCLDVRTAYEHDPFPRGLPEDLLRRFIGYQWQLWTENVDAPWKVDALAWPRGSALAERMWTALDLASWSDFEKDLPTHQERLDLMGVHYHGLNVGDMGA